MEHRGAKIVTRSELLEASWVAVPADKGAKVVERTYRRSLTSHYQELDEHVAEAQRHHADVDRAMRRNRMTDAARSHRALKRCLDGAQRCLRAIADDAALQDIANTQQAQTSDGMGYGTSGGGHSFPAPWSRAERRAAAAALEPPVTVGGAAGVAAIREREFLIAHGHAEAVLRAAVSSTPPMTTRAQRQEALRRLARAP
jgi:hypothetical protein